MQLQNITNWLNDKRLKKAAKDYDKRLKKAANDYKTGIRNADFLFDAAYPIIRLMKYFNEKYPHACKGQRYIIIVRDRLRISTCHGSTYKEIYDSIPLLSPSEDVLSKFDLNAKLLFSDIIRYYVNSDELTPDERNSYINELLTLDIPWDGLVMHHDPMDCKFLNGRDSNHVPIIRNGSTTNPRDKDYKRGIRNNNFSFNEAYPIIRLMKYFNEKYPHACKEKQYIIKVSDKLKISACYGKSVEEKYNSISSLTPYVNALSKYDLNAKLLFSDIIRYYVNGNKLTTIERNSYIDDLSTLDIPWDNLVMYHDPMDSKFLNTTDSNYVSGASTTISNTTTNNSNTTTSNITTSNTSKENKDYKTDINKDEIIAELKKQLYDEIKSEVLKDLRTKQDGGKNPFTDETLFKDL